MNMRKEPTFGEPEKTVSTENMTEKAASTPPKAAAPNVSVRSSAIPGYTFTPVMKRVVTPKTEFQTLEEAQTLQQDTTTTSDFTFTPVAETATPELNTAQTTVEQATQTTIEQTTVEVPAFVKKETPVDPAFKPFNTEAPKTAEKTAAENPNTIERVIPTPTKGTPEKKEKAVKNSTVARLGLVAVLLAILGGIFYWLKQPSSPEGVVDLQSQQSNALPIEFRPVDEEEAKRLEAQAKAEKEAQAQAQQQAQAEQTPAQPAQPTSEQPAAPVQDPATTPTPAVEQNATAPAMPTQPVNGQTEIPTTTETPATPKATIQPITAEQAQQQLHQPTTETAPVVKPAPTPKVHRVEHKHKAVEKPKATAKAEKTVEKTVEKSAEKVRIKAITVEELNAKKARNAQLDELVKNVEEGKPAVAKAPVQPQSQPVKATTNNTVTNTENATVASKTMTVPKSTSLMQVFRDNGLNISDVNAMNKANNVVSNLKVGERVTVRLDKNNRVVEMNIGSGGKFTRQADGSYHFK